MTHADITPQFDPIKAAWNTAATFPTYDEAQSAVHQLSEDGFPIENVDIVGSDLRLVERVTGQTTKLRSMGHGALSGAGLGSFFGLVLGLFSPGFAWIGLIVVGALIGATWGAAFGFASHAVTAGRRGFSSTRNLVAAHYDLVIRGGHTEEARGLLARAGLLPTH
jgi:hypothetical protein